MSMISDALTTMQNITAKMEADKKAAEGPQQELGQDTFLKLMLEQLKCQDPLSPMDNKDFLAQQAQFTQLNEIQKLNQTNALNSQINQACSLIGKDIVLIDPDDASKTIEGKVTAANFTDKLATVIVNDREFPLAYVFQVKAEQQTTAAASEPTATEP